MASPVAHVLVGWSLYLLCRPSEIRWQDALAAAFLTVLPDFDLIALAFVGPAGHYWHHTFTHCAAFALLGGIFGGLLSRFRRGATAWKESALIAMLIASHAVVDYYTVDHSFPRGIPLWWPLTVEFYQSENPLFLNIQRGDFSGQGDLRALFGEHNQKAMLLEFGITLPLFILSTFVFLRGRRRSAT